VFCTNSSLIFPRHRHQEFLAFLRRIVRAFPERELHLVLDNSSTHTTPEVERWLARHSRVHFRFTPTGASWMNMVEGWFSILTRQQVRRGSSDSVAELIAAIERYVAGWNERACPFVWTKNSRRRPRQAIKQQATSDTEHW
jgi:transposase